MGQGTYPVDNTTYNLLQVLTSKLEAIEAYQRYAKEADDRTRQFFDDCRQADEQSTRKALELLRGALAAEASTSGIEEPMRVG